MTALGRAGDGGAGDGRVVLVAAGKDGAGASTTAALLALTFAEQGRRTLLVDGDDRDGGMHRWFGVEPSGGVGTLLSTAAEPATLVLPVSEALSLLPGGGAPDGPAPSAARVRALWRRIASLYDAYDVTIIDGGSRVDTVFAACLAGVQRVVAVSGPDAVSLAATYGLLKAIDALVPDLPVDFVANGEDESRAKRLYARIRALADRGLHRPPAYGGAIPDDPSLRVRGLQGGTFAALGAQNPAVSAAASCGGRILGALSGLPVRWQTVEPAERAARIAVALRYRPGEAPSPVVVASGERQIADQIRRTALTSEVPVIENAVLARALLNSTAVGQEIPADLYAAVAEVLAFVIRQRALTSMRWKGTATA
ncbi:MAG: EscU/YscU/HrcU family type III secretion system export apparatus switch protein [Gemmatimonadota bacterium]|nr:EscU/YscU/HrcU family type III secretion system export apparatus switch protein [Gemmatimonadota bacterium]